MTTNKHFFTIVLGAVAALSISSCQDFDAVDEEVIKHELINKEYTQNFMNRYGMIDPNHDWGFQPMTAGTAKGAFTRSSGQSGFGAGKVNVDRNMWVLFDNNKKEYKDDALSRFVQVPGWPNFDSYYYGEEGFISESELRDGLHPVGDVTEAEIEYVSWWFRSHEITDPTKYRVNLHLSDFFIQNVSADNDQEYYPDGPNKTVAKACNNITTSVEDGEPINYGMDHLVFRPIGGNVSMVDDTWTHVNDFNSGNSNKDTDEAFAGNASYSNTNPIKSNAGTKQTTYRNIKYVTSSGTEDFAYTSSFGTSETSGTTYYNDWVLVHLDWYEVGHDGKKYHRDGYYLAFDYHGEKGSTHVDGDNYYSNWIVKITPAYYKPQQEGYPRRIMCEDLGNTCDFDFNDVVFDIFYEENHASRTCDAVITLQAAGGTLPINVGQEGSEYEAHSLLGHNYGTPVNVGGATSEVAIYRVNVEYRDDHKYDADNISIFVHGHKVDYARANLNKFNGENLVKDPNNASYSDAPQKFSVPISVRWMKERQQIETAYQHFKDWVNYEDGEYREYEGYTGSAWKGAWYDNANLTPGWESHVVIK